MRRPYGSVLALAATVPALVLLSGCADRARAEVVVVRINADGFDPATLVVAPGTEVRWTNDDAFAHTVTSQDRTIAGTPAVPGTAVGWDSGPVRPGETFAHRFDIEGTYLYWCPEHQAEQMVGTVRVAAP
ncbi:hypothetical protein GCM10027280_35660 [Micromonospora polyrhachis]|uniref:Plastocyanin n=1 Tax=Micromonospora polyrhachis TaxID=1282883 RepID=A0A7W7WP45_9ACTN|nr:plastocyanin/azurin family copper-binding protein [Micromonospora polyrhachis]MBB4958831.1 plastocyanin [Micromonospora polyrhachis]